MNDSADMNLNNIPLLATHRGDVNTGKHNLLLHISPSKLTMGTLVRELSRWPAIYTYIWWFHCRCGQWPGQFRLRLIYFHFHFFFTSRSTILCNGLPLSIKPKIGDNNLQIVPDNRTWLEPAIIPSHNADPKPWRFTRHSCYTRHFQLSGWSFYHTYSGCTCLQK